MPLVLQILKVFCNNNNDEPFWSDDRARGKMKGSAKWLYLRGTWTFAPNVIAIHCSNTWSLNNFSSCWDSLRKTTNVKIGACEYCLGLLLWKVRTEDVDVLPVMKSAVLVRTEPSCFINTPSAQLNPLCTAWLVDAFIHTAEAQKKTLLLKTEACCFIAAFERCTDKSYSRHILHIWLDCYKVGGLSMWHDKELQSTVAPHTPPPSRKGCRLIGGCHVTLVEISRL